MAQGIQVCLSWWLLVLMGNGISWCIQVSCTATSVPQQLNLRVTSTTATSMDIKWDNTNNIECCTLRISSLVDYHGHQEFEHVSSTDCINSSSYTVKHLEPGTNYTVRIDIKSISEVQHATTIPSRKLYTCHHVHIKLCKKAAIPYN